MQRPEFVHLRIHSEYSIADGIVRLEAAVQKAAGDHQPALAITDLGNTFAYIKFYKAARAAGVKPILGADVWITNSVDRDRPFRLLLLAQNDLGYKNLCELLTRAWLKNSYRDRGEVRTEWFTEPGVNGQGSLADGLIALSGGLAGEIADALAKSKSAMQSGPADAILQRYLAAFGDRFYLELQRAGHPGEEPYIRGAVALALRHQVPVVATHPVQFLEPEDFRSHEARVCIAEGETLVSGRRQRRFTASQYLASQAEMVEKFSDLPQALANSVEIARRCSVTLQLGRPQLPNFPTPNGESLEDYLRLSAARASSSG